MAPSLAGKRILVVDDEDSLREILIEELAAVGAQTFQAPSGNRAADLLAQNKIDAVISDIRMPDGDGVELLKHIKFQPLPHPIVFLVTGHSDLPQDLATHLGAEALFSKPCDLKLLIETLAKSLTPQHRRQRTAKIDCK